MADTLRFLHASDFHLEAPVGGLAEVPEQLRDLLIDAPRVAAQRVFESAIAHRVDFLLLAGDILHPYNAGPGALAFLLEQFERLEAA